jgi:hypothetical protein
LGTGLLCFLASRGTQSAAPEEGFWFSDAPLISADCSTENSTQEFRSEHQDAQQQNYCRFVSALDVSCIYSSRQRRGDRKYCVGGRDLGRLGIVSAWHGSDVNLGEVLKLLVLGIRSRDLSSGERQGQWWASK